MAIPSPGDGVVVTNSTFLYELAAAIPNDCMLWGAGFIGDPGRGDWSGLPLGPQELESGVPDGWTRQNSYYSVAALKADAAGEFKRKRVNFARLLALVVDDADQDGLQGRPTYVLQTSPGKYQIGVFLDAEDQDCSNERLVSALINRLAKMGLMSADKSGNNIVRYVRLPRGQNQKPRQGGHFDHVLERWDPHQRMTLEDAAAVYGVDLDEIKIELQRQPERAELLASGDQQDKLQEAMRAIVDGSSYHDPVNVVAASLVASGAHPGAVVNTLRSLMEASLAPRDDRWQQRYNDITRSVRTAAEKFTPAIEVAQPAADKPPLFRLAGELLGEIKPVQWLVKGYIEQDALCMVFGPPSAGKSFLSIDIAACVATGKPWHGAEVKKGAVFYVCGEGHNGVTRRMAAWQKVNGRELGNAPLYKSTRAVMVLDRAAAAEMAAEIEAMAAASGVAPTLVIIDTLARNFGDGDENKQADAGRFIEHLDEFVRRRWGCTVMIVHHTGHDADRARGSSAFKAAVDQEISVKPGVAGVVEVAVTKMKDAEIPPPRSMEIRQVGLGRFDDDGEEITGAALAVAGDPLDYQVAKGQKSKRVVKAREVADLMMSGHWQSQDVVAIKLDVARRTLANILTRMEKAGSIERTADGGWKVVDRVLDQVSHTGAMLPISEK